MRRSAVVTGVIASVACWCAAAVAAPPPLFPLGDVVTWRLTDQHGAALVVKASRSAEAYVLRGFPGLGPVRVRAHGSDVQAWDGRGKRWAPFLRLGARTGTRYRVDLPEAPLWRAVDVTVESRSAVCADARDRPVRGCVALALRSRKPVADAGVERLVFAPGVGLAEIVVQTIAGPRTYTLGGGGAPLE
jgi:hypothetical protein